VGEAEEVERRRLRGVMLYSARAFEAEVDHLRFVGVQGQTELCQSLSQHLAYANTVEEVLKDHHEVVAEPHKADLPLHAGYNGPLKPLVQRIVQVDVG